MSNDHETIIAITDKARDHLKAFLAESGAAAGISLGVKKTGCSGYSYLVDVAQQPRPDALCLTVNQVPLFISPDCIDIIRGALIDFVDKDNGQKQLVFNNPNAEGLCGCGESFTLKTAAKEGE